MIPSRRSSLLLTCLIVLGIALPQLAAARQATPTQDADGPVVTLDSGDIRGVIDDEVARFRGIPYAAPPIGDLRWGQPQPPEPWDGVRDASASGPICPQATADPGAPVDTAMDEDCLTVNVTLPARPSDTPRPVMVWLHGGGFTNGAGSEYDAARLATEGDVIIVTVEFRIGVLSAMALPGMDDAGTYGMQDQQEALRWVQRNAAAFGGDPENVTLFGESGGAIATCGHLASPASAGLFHKAILQSGSCETLLLANAGSPGFPQTAFWRPLEEAVIATRAAAAELGCPVDASDADLLACLREQPADVLLAFTGTFNPMAWGGETLPRDPVEVQRAGDLTAVPVISGHTDAEAEIFVNAFAITEVPITDDTLSDLLVQGFGDAAPAVEGTYTRDRYPDATAVWSSAYTDAIFACPQARLNDALAANAPVFAYRFADETALSLVPAVPGQQPPPNGASHGSELPYLFDMPGVPVTFDRGEVPLTDTQRAVASDMIAAWSSFAWNGTPSVDGTAWPEWSSDGAAREITSSPGSTETIDPIEFHRCGFWGTTPLPATPVGTPAATPMATPAP